MAEQYYTYQLNEMLKRYDQPGDVHLEQLVLNAIGEKIAQYRDLRGMSIEGLATLLHLDPQKIMRMEMGAMDPTYFFEILPRFVQALGIPQEKLDFLREEIERLNSIENWRIINANLEKLQWLEALQVKRE